MTLPRRAFLGIELARGALEVAGVVAPSMADAAELRKGDLLLAIDGVTMTSEENLALALRTPKERVVLVIDHLRRRCTILTRPTRAGLHTVIAILQGSGEESIETLSVDLPLGLARAGFGTLRVERRALGDSEGDPSSRRPEQEIASFVEALRRLKKESWV